MVDLPNDPIPCPIHDGHHPNQVWPTAWRAAFERRLPGDGVLDFHASQGPVQYKETIDGYISRDRGEKFV